MGSRHAADGGGARGNWMHPLEHRERLLSRGIAPLHVLPQHRDLGALTSLPPGRANEGSPMVSRWERAQQAVFAPAVQGCGGTRPFSESEEVARRSAPTAS
eukprot:scaffold176730_cov28-Tisochrysis_lutea.AAC.2